MNAPVLPPNAKTSPFSHGNLLSAVQRKRLTVLLDELGLRRLPYPFASAVAVVSDVDASTRDRYNGYVGMMVAELGLDFGDSTWLQWQYVTKRRDTVRYTQGFGFFSRYFSFGHDEPADLLRHTRTSVENLIEYHAGNVDHFHSYLPYGPRVIVADALEARDGRAESHFKEFQSRGMGSPRGQFLFAVVVVGRPGKQLGPCKVSVLDYDDAITADFQEFGSEARDGCESRVFVLFSPADAPRSAPRLDQIRRVTVEMEDPERADDVRRFLLASVHGDILLDRLGLLHRRYNVEAGLLTDHAAYHFRNEAAARIRDTRQLEHVARYVEPTESFYGRLHDAEGGVVFSTDADDPLSLCRVFPEVSRDLELRFVVPAGNTASSTTGWDVLNLVTPALTRAGSGIYVARRTMPNIGPPLPGKIFDGIKSRQETFAERIRRVVEGVRETPGGFWPVYTHLGGFNLDDDHDSYDLSADRPLPSPYFEPGPLRELQDRTLNITGAVEPQARIWFTRASVMYDYALMLRSIPEHVERPGPNTVLIRSWFDPVLGKEMPRSPAQLYGLTFYVEDAATAEVQLDGALVPALVRNPADETGRASVTIAEAEIRSVVFDELDPTANRPDEVATEGGAWTWFPATSTERAFGRLTIGETGGAVLRIPLHGWSAMGAQLLTVDVRSDEDAHFALVLETGSGGRFVFGEGQPLARLNADATASYALPRRPTPGDWRTVVVPFHDLRWRPGSAPGGAMPNHPLDAIMLVCEGPAGSTIDVARLAVLRPRATSLPRRESRLFCLGGAVPSFEPGQVVHCASAEAQWTEGVDQRGCFCFAGLAPGIYRVWSPSADGELHDRRGALVEVGGDTMTLVLNRAALRP